MARVAEQLQQQLDDRPLEVCVVTETYPPEVNGVAHTVAKLVVGLTAKGHRVHLIRPRQHAGDGNGGHAGVQTTLVPGMKVPFYPDLRMGLPAGELLAKQCQRRRPDALYVATEGPLGRSAMKRARALGIPVISGFHTNFHSYSSHYGFGFLNNLIYGYLRRLHNAGQCTVVPTADLQAGLLRDGFDNVEVLGRGVDATLFSPTRRSEALRRSWGAGPDDMVALYVGRLAKEKDIPLAIETFDRLREQHPGMRFVLVGDGPMYEKLYRRNNGLIFCGTKTGEELAEHYASADVFLFPSQTETYGNVILEALASGLAVLAFDYAAPHELIAHGDNGWLVPFGERDGFLPAARALMADRDALAGVRRRARRTAEGRDWDRIVARFEGLVRECERTGGEHGDSR